MIRVALRNRIVQPHNAFAPPRAARWSASVLAALLGLAIATACSGSGGDGAAKTTTSDVGGTMIVVQPAEPGTLFPPKATYSAEFAVINSVFDKLADIAPDLSVIGDKGYRPRLATSWQWASDSLSIAFALDPKAHWHDGQPLRADDVKYTFAVYTADSVGADAKSLLGNIDSVTVRDSLTAVFWYKRRLPQQFFDATYHMYVLPSHLLASTPMTKVGDAPFGRQPVGTGRFRFAKWDAGARIEILADTTNARGRAKLDRVVWTFTQDFGAATVKLFAGEADFYEAIRPDNLPQVARVPSLRLEPAPALQYGFLDFNLHARGSKTAPHPIFGDVRVRRALAMAVDRPRLVRSVFDSLGLVALAYAPRALIPDTTSLVQLPFNVAAARALLDSAGWTMAKGDSVRGRNGLRLIFEIMAPSSALTRQRYATLLQEQLRPLGVGITVRVLEGPAMGGKVMAHDFDSFMHVWDMTPGRMGMSQTWTSSGNSNFGGYASAAFDATLDSAYTSFDVATSAQTWSHVFQQLIDDEPGILLYEPHTPVAIHRRIHNPPLRANGWFQDLADWYVDPAQRIERDRIGLGRPR